MKRSAGASQGQAEAHSHIAKLQSSRLHSPSGWTNRPNKWHSDYQIPLLFLPRRPNALHQAVLSATDCRGTACLSVANHRIPAVQVRSRQRMSEGAVQQAVVKEVLKGSTCKPSELVCKRHVYERNC